MHKKARTVLFVGLWSATTVCLAAKIPEQIGNWLVTVGPAGNAVYRPPKTIPQDTPPPEAALGVPTIFVPHLSVTDWKIDDGAYEIECEEGDEQYQFTVRPDGTLLELQYENNQTNIKEEADELVYAGTKKAIEIEAVPSRALRTLSQAYPGKKPEKAWTARTVAGLRYVIQTAGMAFYARSDGQIQAARELSDGGLDEIDPKDRPPVDEEQFRAEMERLLSPYRKRFNMQSQIKKLGSTPKNPDGSYRYVVMGDSRSQWDLWSSIVKHIDSLDPKPAFVINSGDLVPDGFASQFRNYYIPPLLETDIPFFVAIGNHDEGYEDRVLEYRYLFGNRSLNYFFDYGRARYIFIDNATEALSHERTLKWLGRTLADTPNGYRKYVAAHQPPSTIRKWAYHAWDSEESKLFTDLMTTYEVSEVYLGHIHAYSTAEFGGVRYTVSGGGGAGLHDRFGALGNVHHYVICDVQANGTVKQQVVRFHKKQEDG
ncbi:MAG: metallophosphoesterase [Phycisphaerales bacterium]|nr:MAG: metallophosphoesterase [Phycisphaerales bacterium]